MASNRNNNDNRIRGPTSALTSFLRERGIRPRNLNYRNPPPQPQPQPTDQTDDAASQNNEDTQDPDLDDDDDDDDPQAESSSAAATHRRSTRLALSSSTTVETASASTSTTTTVTLQYTAASTLTSGQRKRKKKDDSSDSENDDLTPVTSPTTPRAGFSNRSRATRTRIEFCSLCRCRFSVIAALVEEGKENLICPTCASGGKDADAKKMPKRRKAKGPKVAGEDGFVPVPTLQDLCIKVIAHYIEDVEALGNIGEINMDKICKIICKNRQLNNHVARLFMDPQETQMSFYDCTGLDTTGFLNIAQFCPKLHTLTLNTCGRLSDPVTDKYASHLLHLRSLTLSGPYLVTGSAWTRLFTSLGSRLESFTLEHSPRLDLPSLDILVTSCPNLRDLRLMRISKLDNSWLPHISRLQKLEALDISHPGAKLTSGSLVDLLKIIGSRLRELGLRSCVDLTDEALVDGVLPNCARLQMLAIAGCDLFTSAAAAKLFNEWREHKANPGLVRVDLARCSLFEDEVVEALVRHSAKTLRELNVNSLEELTCAGFEALAGVGANGKINNPCSELVEIDAGFCRAVDDGVVERLMKGCKELRVLKVFGNHKVTESAYRRKGVQLLGQQWDTL
ncbi:hypothetical protein BC936DRAFT_138365 [Jimgerdemannia flammicorona]|uniref:RNI-like protein n=1 Tax=Jimgerdemannia flammicorona TaxID=994334 RepID=A0A433DMY3_9FUNG|nr:hypothetical protein BC936DRAFT_138365 [Jimgerdemannia flammicorona]